MGRDHTRRIRLVRLPVLFGGLFLLAPAAGAEPAFTIGQTVRWLRQERGVDAGETWVGYTSVSFRNSAWTARGSVSWLSWSPDPGTADLSPERSGPGALYLLAGRRFWQASSPEGAGSASAWIRLRGKVPLRNDPSPITSGELDWGASVLLDTRIRRVSLLAEAGFLILGESGNVSYRNPVTGALSVGYAPRNFPLKPLATVLVASSARAGDPAYLEFSGGVSLTAWRRFTIGLLASHGATDAAPREGFALNLTYRP
jgi:hypothetical protein